MKKIVCVCLSLYYLSTLTYGAIDRFALVNRHRVKIDKVHSFSPLSVGNGRFAYTVDITGLQSFPTAYQDGIPLTTMAEWGWHSFPNTNQYKLEDTFVDVDTYGRPVPYNIQQKGPAGDYLRANPHQITLGLIGLVLKKNDGKPAEAEDLTDINQILDLWQGMIISHFKVNGKEVKVQTCIHPYLDQIAIRIESELIRTGDCLISLKFPYAAGTWGRDPADWSKPDKHQTRLVSNNDGSFLFERTMDQKQYYCQLNANQNSDLKYIEDHYYQLIPDSQNSIFECSISFNEDTIHQPAQPVVNIQNLCSQHWQQFWMTGGAIDLSKSKDPRWQELERRIVLSQYLTAIQSGQKYPPQETGLTCNSWFGKFHLEMHWWHSVHFALWDRLEMLERGIEWYHDIMPAARAIARRQGYQGVRWPKMTNPNGEDSPSGIGPLLIWQQPHPIYFAELIYREKPTRTTLEQYQDIVFSTAEFMADFSHWDAEQKRYVLGPPVIPAQENYKYAITWNPTYELCYWSWGLNTAQQWRERLGLARQKDWDHIIDNLSSLPVQNGIYSAVEPPPYTNITDHPSMLAALGLLPKTPLVDESVMRQTALDTYRTWSWPDTWGWDYPMLAMTAARTGLRELAVDAFFIVSKKNLYWPNGHNYQRENLPLYLPGNGGLLTAVAMMAAGWDGAPPGHAPGFPDNGNWIVEWEGLKRMP